MGAVPVRARRVQPPRRPLRAGQVRSHLARLARARPSQCAAVLLQRQRLTAGRGDAGGRRLRRVVHRLRQRGRGARAAAAGGGGRAALRPPGRSPTRSTARACASSAPGHPREGRHDGRCWRARIPRSSAPCGWPRRARRSRPWLAARSVLLWLTRRRMPATHPRDLRRRRGRSSAWEPGASRSSTARCSTTPSGRASDAELRNLPTRASSPELAAELRRGPLDLLLHAIAARSAAPSTRCFMLIGGLDRGSWSRPCCSTTAPGAERLAERAEATGLAVRVDRADAARGVGGAAAARGRALRSRRAARCLPRPPELAAGGEVRPRRGGSRAGARGGRDRAADPGDGGSTAPASCSCAPCRGASIATSPSRMTLRGQLIERFRWPAAKVEVVYNAVDLDPSRRRRRRACAAS